MDDWYLHKIHIEAMCNIYCKIVWITDLKTGEEVWFKLKKDIIWI